jgi:hypothetical protein
MPAPKPSRERPEKILVAMHALSSGGTEFLKYEDIVVKAFTMFPDEFALRGYPQYPDSSDIHKPLYGALKRHGLIRAADKAFALTPLGVERAQKLLRAAGSAIEEQKSAERLTRAEENEIDRMLKSEALALFVQGKQDKILDTDFFGLLGCTVRTSKNDYLGRLTATKNAVRRAKSLGKPDTKTSKLLTALMDYVIKQFGQQIN